MINAKIARQESYDILMLGDSITHLLDESRHLNPEWVEQSGRNFKYYTNQMKGKTILNAGISGEETTHLLSRLQNGLSEARSEYTVILIGTNDAKRRISAEQVAKNIEDAINIVSKSNTGTQILLYAIFPRGNSKEHVGRLKNQAVNDILEKLPKKFNNVKFIDINKKLKERNGTLSKKIMYDFLHPTLDGYKIWIESIKSEVE